MGTTSCRAVAVAALFLALLACCPGVTAQSPAPETAGAPSPAAGGGCFNALMNMSDCLTFVSDGSNQTKPDKGCCPELAGLYDSNPICLCELLGNPDSIGIKIDLNQALKLPSACGLDTPPVSTCSGQLISIFIRKCRNN